MTEEEQSGIFQLPPGRRLRRAVVGMSGGVDSTFAAWALVQAGVEVIGIHLHMGDFEPGLAGPPRCCSAEDARDARRMAQRLGIPFYVISAAAEFEREVIRPFAENYAAGLTPNPCLRCNPRIKWFFLIRKAKELDADAVATGHHARVLSDPASGRPRLLRSIERKKDQSYFLARLSPEQLAWAVLPAGSWPKQEIRRQLAAAGLPVAAKAESQDICFVGPEGYAALVERVLGDQAPRAGEIVDQNGRVLGEHRGLHYYTVGQRKGLGFTAGEAYYVLALDPLHNRIIVGPRRAVYQTSAVIEQLLWLAPPPSEKEICSVRIRYQSRPAGARVILLALDRAQILFLRPQRAITPGQAAVIYRGVEVVGSGLFTPSLPAGEEVPSSSVPASQTGTAP